MKSTTYIITALLALLILPSCSSSKTVLPYFTDISTIAEGSIPAGDYNPTIKLCIAICKVLGRTLDDLFWESE